MLNILFKGFTDFSGISFIIRVKESWFYSHYTLKDVWVVFNYSNTMKEVKILAHECNDLLNPYSSLLLISAVKNKFVGFLLLLKKKKHTTLNRRMFKLFNMTWVRRWRASLSAEYVLHGRDNLRKLASDSCLS